MPQEVLLDENRLHLEYKPDDECYEDELLDAVSDWLSDEYGFCHGGFEIEQETAIGRIFALIEPVLANSGYQIIGGDDETLIIRNKKDDEDFEIRIEQIVN